VTDRARLAASLLKHEAYRAAPYKCPAGRWTVGIGHNLEANPLTASQWKRLLDAGHIAISLSQAGAGILVTEEADKLEKELARELDFWNVLNDARQNVLCEMAFNLGLPGLLQFKQTLFAIRSGQYDIAADRMLASKWAGQVGKRAQTLAQQMRSGVFA
jgi:lysozyme